LHRAVRHQGSHNFEALANSDHHCHKANGVHVSVQNQSSILHIRAAFHTYATICKEFSCLSKQKRHWIMKPTQKLGICFCGCWVLGYNSLLNASLRPISNTIHSSKVELAFLCMEEAAACCCTQKRISVQLGSGERGSKRINAMAQTLKSSIVGSMFLEC